MGATRGSVGCLSLSQNGIIRQHKTQALMGATRLASGCFQQSRRAFIGEFFSSIGTRRPIALMLAFPVVAVSEVPIILS